MILVLKNKWQWFNYEIQEDLRNQAYYIYTKRGFSQKEGINYDKFAPLARHTSLVMYITLDRWCNRSRSSYRANSRNRTLYREPHVHKLKKALYGLKLAPRKWYDMMDNFLMSLGFTKSKEDSNLYFKVEDGRRLILLLCVDDLFLT